MIRGWMALTLETEDARFYGCKVRVLVAGFGEVWRTVKVEYAMREIT